MSLWCGANMPSPFKDSGSVAKMKEWCVDAAGKQGIPSEGAAVAEQCPVGQHICDHAEWHSLQEEEGVGVTFKFIKKFSEEA
eukprot:4376781-Ditylum_brightwellii.AAC.1